LNGLQNILTNVQIISEAISSVLNIDVTVVDKNFLRVAGTGSYKGQIGEFVDKYSVFAYALNTGNSFIIENPGKHPACNYCNSKINCQEYAEVSIPIKGNEQVEGVIGLIAFDEKQRAEIINNQSNLLNFLGRMADLIATKLIEQEQTDKLKRLAKELEIVLNSVDRGIILVDKQGYILKYNNKAQELFQLAQSNNQLINITEISKDFTNSNILLAQKEIKNKEFIYEKKEGGGKLRGLFDTKPIMLDNELLGILYSISNLKDVLNFVNNLTTNSVVTTFDTIIGNSPVLEKVKVAAKKASNSPSTILIQGESGTGKELFARAIHFESERKNKPFIPINCAAIPEQLLESELFGYVEGAFTGAKKKGKTGKFELAHKGTIFLDEIGEMPLHLQSKLLRVLQDYVIEKVGGAYYIPVDVRVIAATNQDLERKILEGEFRHDLYYRLNVIPITIPPLRERKEDLEILVQHFLEKYNRILKKNIRKVAYDVMALLDTYDWPGNVRELENTIEYAVNMCNSSTISLEDLPTKLKIKKEKNLTISQEKNITPITDLEIAEIKKTLEIYGNTKNGILKASKALGISKATLYRKLKTYNLQH